jgi:hypothetical protein
MDQIRWEGVRLLAASSGGSVVPGKTKASLEFVDTATSSTIGRMEAQIEREDDRELTRDKNEG